MELSNKSKVYNKRNTLIFSCQYHVIWATKYRRKVLSEKMQNKIKELILKKQNDYGYKILDMEIMPDHIHLLIDHVDITKMNILQVVGRIKGYTSHEMREIHFPELKKRLPSLWTRSKFVASVGAVSLEIVKKYIDNQKNK